MDRTQLTEGNGIRSAFAYLDTAYHECAEVLHNPRKLITAALANLMGEKHDDLDKLREFEDDLQFMEEWLEKRREVWGSQSTINTEGRVLALRRLVTTGKRSFGKNAMDPRYDETLMQKKVATILQLNEGDKEQTRKSQIYELERQARHTDDNPYHYEEYLKDMGLILIAHKCLCE